MSKSTLKILPALMVAITAAWLTQPVFGAAVTHQLVMTETSSTSLDVTYDAVSLTVSNTGPDLWTFTLPTTFTPNGVFPEGFLEPESVAINVNLLSTTGVANQLSVASDVSIALASTLSGNGIVIGQDSNGAFIQASFFDNAATSEATVPDTGTTFSLLGLSLMGLAFLRRKILA